MRQTIGYALVIAALGQAGPALAEEWQGGYAGVTAGQSWIEDEARAFSILAVPIGPPLLETLEGDGPSIGALIGYRTTLGPLVVGGEADLDWSDAKLSTPANAITTSSRIKWQGSARGVVGVPAGKALIYATGGIGFANTRHSTNFGLGAPPFDWSRTPRGWVAGAGVELNLGKIRPRLEYRHAAYERTSSNPSSPIIYFRKVSSDSVRVSAVFAF